MIYLCRTFLNVHNPTIKKYSQNSRNAASEDGISWHNSIILMSGGWSTEKKMN